MSSMIAGSCPGSFYPTFEPGPTYADLRAANARQAEEIAGLRAALRDTYEGIDGSDGLACWCPSPTYAKARGHTPRCMKCRSALSTPKDPRGKDEKT